MVEEYIHQLIKADNSYYSLFTKHTVKKHMMMDYHWS